MIRRKEVKGLLFLLLVSITVSFGLSSAGCKKKSEKPGPTGQTTFTSPDDAATKTFGSLSVASDNIITARASQSEMITGRIITGRAITARIITGRIITARSPKFMNVSESNNNDNENDILNLFGRLKKSRLSKKQSEGSEISCEDVKPKCVEGKVEKAECNKDQSTNMLIFDIKVSDCKEIVDEQKGDYIVSTGYAKGYLEISTKVSQGSGEAKFIVAIEEGDSLVKEFIGNKETKRVRAKASKFRTEITGRFIEGEKDVDFRVVTKLSGSYSREDEIGNRKEAYSYSDYVVELTGKSPKSGGEGTLYVSIVGGYSVDTEPDSCVEGAFNFKTIKPIKSSGGQGYCGAESGEIEVNNAKMEFSSGKVKVSVENQQKEYRCEELRGLCKYEPITIAEGIEEKPCPVWFKDKDKDGYTDGTTKVSCSKPSDEYVSSATSGDCNDNDPNINPAKAEICDGKDNNCNNQIDEGVLLVFYKDSDKDGYTDGTTKVSCSKPSDEYVSSATSGDCDDTDSSKNPGKTEICDGKDNDCDGQTDEGFSVGQSCTAGVGECARTGQYVCKADGSGTECNAVAGTPTTEICDGKDNDCDGQTDEGNVCAPASTFAKTIGGGGDDFAYSITQSSDGGYVVAGWTESFGAGSEDIYVVKLDSSGNVVWTKTIGGSLTDGAGSIIQSSDGGYVVAGGTLSFGAGYADFYVVKLDSSGNVLWTKTIGGSNDDEAISIIQSSDGGYVVAGNTRSFGAGGGDMYIVKLDSAGNVLWTKTIGGSGDDVAFSIIQSSDGGYVVAGWTDSFGAGYADFYVVKLDSSGNVQWTKTIGGSNDDEARSIIQSSDGGYVVAGYTESFGVGARGFYVVKLDSSGNVVWTKTIGGSSGDEAWSIIQSSDGGYVVAGGTLSFGAGYADFYVVKLDSSGNVLWTKTIGGSNIDWANSIIQSSDGGYVVAGGTTSFGAGYADFYVVKLDANGNVCFSQNITNYSVSSTVPSFSSPSTVAISQSPTVNSVSPTVSYGGSVSDVCASAPAPHLCSASQDCSFSSAIATSKEDVKSYGCSVGSVLSRFLIPASMLIIYCRLRKKRKKKKGGKL